MARYACLVAGFILVGDFVRAQDSLKGANATSHSSPHFLHVEVVDDVVTVKTQDTTVQDLLEEIARQSALTIVLHDSLDERITIEFHQLSLREALRRILRYQSFALESVQPLSDGAKSSHLRPRTLWVLSKGTRDDRGRDQDGMSLSSELTPTIVVLRSQLMSQDARIREAAVEDLGALGVVEAVAPLSLALSDPDADVRIAATRALAHIGGVQATAALTVAVRNQNSPSREEAVEALGIIGGNTAMQVLKEALKVGSKDVRKAAIVAMAEIGGEEAARAVVTTLHDYDAGIREQAVETLG